MILRIPERLDGALVRLRRSTPADAPAVHRMARDPEVTRYMQWATQRDPSEAEVFLAGTLAGWESGRELHWMLERLHDGAPVGCMGCRVREEAVDFGYFLAHDAWGQGYATDACRTLVGWLKAHGVARIWATTDHENLRSAAVLERAGLVREAVLPGATSRPNLGGAPRDTLVYALHLDARAS